jgi:hypothetical protein
MELMAFRDGIAVNRKWLMPLWHPDLQGIIKRGFGKVMRSASGSARREFKRKGSHVSYVVLTPKGYEELAKHGTSQGNRFDEMAHRVAAIEASRVRAKSATPE